MRRPWVAMALLLGCGSGGGGKSDQQIADEYRPTVMPKLEAIMKAGQAADAPMMFDQSWPTAAVPGLDFSDATGNAVMVMRDDLKDLRADAGLELRFARLEFDPVRTSQRVLGLVADRMPTPARDHEARLQQLARARYALIVLTREVDQPIVVGTRFHGGKVRGVALLFELDKTELLGGFQFTAYNSDRALSSGEYAESRLREDLAHRLGERLIQGLEMRFPGAKPPDFLGYTAW